MGVLITNATVSIKHSDGTLGPQHVRVCIEPPRTEQFTALGGQSTSTVLFDANLDIRPAGDRMTVESLDSFTTLASVKPYELLNVTREGGVPILACIRAEVRGFIT